MTSGPGDRTLWNRVTDLFHRALELAAGERTEFVRRESSGDQGLEREVLSLLAAHERNGGFLTSPTFAPQDLIAAGRVGQRLGKYRIDRILGEGGMGVVYLAEDESLGLNVALKAIAPAVARDPAARDRLKREARATAALRGHPGIATVYELEEFDGDLFIVSEYVDGDTMRVEIERGPAAASQVLADALELGRALAAAHERGIVHRDLKPENIIRSSTGPLKILDFGLARMRNTPPELAQLSHDGRTFGTPGYMSPEQIRRKDVDGRSDLFALGILLHERLTGVHPFVAEDGPATIQRILEDEPTIGAAFRPVDSADASLYDKIIDIVRTLMRKNAADRFPSSAALVAVLEQVRSGGSRGISAPIPAAVQAEWTPDRRWWRIHEIVTCIAYTLLLIPVALAADTLRASNHSSWAMPFFLAALAPAVGAVAIRLHLWFEAASRPRDWSAQYSRSWRWLRVCDVLFALAMIGLALAIDDQQHLWKTILVSGSVLVLVSAMLIEPATTRAAFDQR